MSEKQLYIVGSLGRAACCPALGCMADAGLNENPQGRGFIDCLSRFSGRGWGRVPGCRTGSNRAWALDTEPKLVWGVGDGSGHFFPFEGGMLQEERG